VSKHECFFLLNRGSVRSETQLLTRQVTNFGIWSPVEYCPWGTYIVGMSLKSHSDVNDSLGLTGVKLYCSQISTLGQLITDRKPFITSGTFPAGEFGNIFYCSGFLYGFQLKIEPYQGPHGDDTGINNIRLFCDNGKFTFPLEDVNGGGREGSWREVYTCPLFEVLCGVETQIDSDPSSEHLFSIHGRGVKAGLKLFLT